MDVETFGMKGSSANGMRGASDVEKMDLLITSQDLCLVFRNRGFVWMKHVPVFFFFGGGFTNTQFHNFTSTHMSSP